MRYMLTDDLRAALEPLVERAKAHKGGQPPRVPDRVFFEALLYWGRTGVPWRDLPAAFGRWDAVDNRFRRWEASGGLRRLFELLTAAPAFGEVRRVFVDGTIVRAHAHAAGARRQKKLGPEASAAAQATGRGRGGLSTEVIVAASDEDTVLAVDVVPGQAGEAPRLVPLVDRVHARGVVVDEVVADKGFDGDRVRERCIDRGVNPNIPLKGNRDPDRWEFDPASYKGRNKVGRLFSKAKPFRRVATRYGKLKRTYRGLLHLTFGYIRLRRLRNVNRP